MRIAVSPSGDPWVTNNSHQIFRRIGGVGGSWSVVSGAARDVGIGSDGMVWVIGTTAVAGGHQIHRWNGVSWVLAPGGAINVSVGPVGKAWVVNSFNQLFRWL